MNGDRDPVGPGCCQGPFFNSKTRLYQPGWIAYFNTASKQFLTNLHAVLADKAYLIFLGGGSSITLTVTGTPSVKKIKWVPDSFNLVGFSLAGSEDAVSFGKFFSRS
ncbi:hypothetical protein [uncultured Desulfobacter sp.]|uniref:hypothetical protein n=1 Tax=uncultured Desulfobacter sp. TaxID=240139 RepID=UPI0029F55EAF|nr:hypothetical protein [uncultured Desulfobacter sp.]